MPSLAASTGLLPRSLRSRGLPPCYSQCRQHKVAGALREVAANVSLAQRHRRGTHEDPPWCSSGSVRVMDMRADITASCDPRSSCYVDGVHTSLRGATVIAQAVARELAPCAAMVQQQGPAGQWTEL